MRAWKTGCLPLLFLCACPNIFKSSEQPPKPPPRRSLIGGYAGIDACAECHAERVVEFKKTAHFRTSALPTQDTIEGSFDQGKNLLLTSNRNLWFEMEARQDRFVQSLHVRRGAEVRKSAEPFAFVIGSGRHGQSYLAWAEDKLYQLPVGYFRRLGGWANTPGQIDGYVNRRPIYPRCLECHSTFFTSTATGALTVAMFDPRYKKTDYLLGVTCERCHGPGNAHIEHHRKTPGKLVGEKIKNPRDLPHAAGLAVCGQCHAGIGTPKRRSFSFRPGDPLDAHLNLDMRGGQTQGHAANQLARLARSACFKKSKTMTCFDCHNPHEAPPADPASALKAQSQKCSKCHASKPCRRLRNPAKGPDTAACIDCHMPFREDPSIAIQTAQETVHPKIRDHRIGIYRP